MSLELLYALTALTAPIVAKNVGMAVTDSLSMGIAAALKKSVEEIKERADQSNENIFYWQVASFLEASSDVPIEEVTRFLEQHPQGYRLGAEVFKILETTYIEKQAELIAIAFKQRVKRKIDDKKFNQYIHIITQLNHHTIQALEDDLIGVRDYALHKLPTEDNETSRMGFLFHGVSNSRHNGYSSHSLEILGLITEDLEKQQKQSSAFPEKVFKRTDLYLSFYLDIYKDQIPAS